VGKPLSSRRSAKTRADEQNKKSVLSFIFLTDVHMPTLDVDCWHENTKTSRASSKIAKLHSSDRNHAVCRCTISKNEKNAGKGFTENTRVPASLSASNSRLNYPH